MGVFLKTTTNKEENVKHNVVTTGHNSEWCAGEYLTADTGYDVEGPICEHSDLGQHGLTSISHDIKEPVSPALATERRYMVFDWVGGDLFEDLLEARTEAEALNAFDRMWNSLTAVDKKRRKSFELILADVSGDGGYSLERAELIEDKANRKGL